MTQSEINYILDHKSFITTHLQEDPFQLALKFGSDPDKKLLIGQIGARQKIRKKLPEWYANPELVFPTTLSLEQASSEATAQLKAGLISGNTLLDITGGLGVDCFYLSRSFRETTYVEKDSNIYNATHHNFLKLGAPIKTIHADGLEILQNSEADVVYVDPYRRDEAKNKVVALSDCLPDVTGISDLLTKSGRTALIKASPMLDLNLAVKQLKFVKEIWVISHRNDCKEVVFLLNREAKDIIVKTFDFYPENENLFQFQWEDKSRIKPETGNLGEYLYEPNASILKSGGQDVLAGEFSLAKLHPNSNFFTSHHYLSSYPGKVFKVLEQLRPFDKSLKKGRYNVISRNFPEKASEIEKKLKLKSADKDYLIATRLQDGSLTFIMAQLLAAAK